ncbi:hypothetical protein D3C87_1717750 [compost metagenome]
MLESWTVDQQRHIFTRMIRSAVDRVVPMVCRDDQEIVLRQCGEQLRQRLVKHLQCMSVTLRIAAVTVKGIEVDQIGE